jgi:hypothetical protein
MGGASVLLAQSGSTLSPASVARSAPSVVKRMLPHGRRAIAVGSTEAFGTIADAWKLPQR